MQVKAVKAILLHLGIAALYVVLAKLGLFVATLNGNVSPVWPATGFAISIVFLLGRNFLIAIAAGAFIANFYTDAAFGAAVLIAIGNTAEAFIGSHLLALIKSRKVQWRDQIDTIGVIASSSVASVVSASVGTLALYFFGSITSDLIFPVWLTWWIGDCLGGLVVVPLIAFRTQAIKIRSEWLHKLVNLGLVGLFCYMVFGIPEGAGLVFLLFIPLLYSILWVDAFWMFMIAAMIAVISIASTINGQGPFSQGMLNEKLTHLQFFLASMAITALFLNGFKKGKFSRTPAAVLLSCWFLSGVIFYSFDSSEKEHAEARVTALASKGQENALWSMQLYEEALRSGVGLYSASKSVEFDEWRDYFRMLRVSEHHSGLIGMGVLWPVANPAKFKKEMKAQGVNDVSMKPLPGFKNAEGIQYIVKFIEPLDRNTNTLGIDYSSDPIRRSAAELARDTGKTAITARLNLVESPGQPTGFVYFLPVYKKNFDVSTVENRRKAHVGWIFGPLDYGRFFSHILENTPNEIELQAYDGEELTPDHLLFSNFRGSSEGQYDRLNHINFGQRKISLAWRRSPSFSPPHDTIITWVGFCGAIASLLLTNVILSLYSLGRRSREMADELTKELLISQEKLKAGERRLIYALEGSNDGIWDWNIEKSEMYVSDKISQQYGWPSVSVLKSPDDLNGVCHPDDIPKIRESLRRYFAGETQTHEVENRYKNKNGEWNWVLTRGKVSERSADGKPIRMTGVHIDINALKNSQILLEETQRQLENIANSVPSLISQWDENLYCRFANDSFSSWFGLAPDQVVGRSMDDLLGPEAYTRNKQIFVDALSGKHQQIERETTRVFDGEKRYVIATYLPDYHAKKASGFFLFIQDVTELKKAELIAKEERLHALEATNIKSQFLANMSHEIRTPINGIIGMTGLLQETTLDPKQREYTEVVARSSESLLTIINDILDFSKVEAGKLELDMVDFDLTQLLLDVHKSFSFSAEEKDIELSLQTQLGSTSFFKGDPGRLRQILTNLVGNSIKFSPRGKIMISAQVTHQDSLKSSIHFEVIDNGIGIPDQKLKRMFQAFSQADATTSRKFGGTGLGLSISKQLVDLMGGEIGVISQADRGSTFWFNLVLNKGERPEQEENKQTEITKGARILVADDNQINQRLAFNLLKEIGYNPHAVGEGEEVLEAIRESEYDLILIDTHMLEMDGFRTTEIIRNSTTIYENQIPIIGMTGSLPNEKELGKKAGMNATVAKPLNRASLVKVIESILQKKMPSQDSKARILVVEDNKVNQKVIGLNLEKLKYSVEIANNGVEAVQMVKERDYDLILMDCQMPEMDGYQASQEIRKMADERKASLPIIALTANAVTGDREKCLAAGMNDYLTKPIQIKIVTETLARWIGKKHELDQALNTPHVDRNTIEQLKSLQRPGRPDLVKELILLFFDSAQGAMEKIRSSVSNNDMSSLSSVAHALKSSAANLGANRFAYICRQLEEYGDLCLKNETPADFNLQEVMESLEREYHLVSQELVEIDNAA